jgi:hypothetical protein
MAGSNRAAHVSGTHEHLVFASTHFSDVATLR